MSIIIPGFTPSYRVPMVAAVNEFGAGPSSVGEIPLACVCFGNKTSDGSAVLNTRYPISTPAEARSIFGARSELTRMLIAGFDAGGGVSMYGVAVAEAAGSAAALPIVISGTWTEPGEITIQIDEAILRVPVAASHTASTFGDALEDAINAAQDGSLFCLAANTAGRVVLTVASLGVRGNQHACWLDTSKAPTGMVVAFDQSSDVTETGTGPLVAISNGTPSTDINGKIEITTGGTLGTSQFRWSIDDGATWVASNVPTAASVTLGTTGLTATFPAGTYVIATTYTWKSYAALGNGGQPFYGGTGTDDITAALDATESLQHDYIAPAHNDAVNVAAIEAKVNAKAAFDIGLLENYIVCLHRTLAAAISIGQTTMNDALGGCFWAQDHVEHPSRTAARLAALFSVTEASQPNTRYDDVVVPGAAPHYRPNDSPNKPTQNAALNASVSPLKTENGKLKISRAIGSRSLNGSSPDYRTYDRAESIVPLRVRKELVVKGDQIREEMPYDGPDPSDGGLPPASSNGTGGTLTPRYLKTAFTSELKRWEGPDFNWLTDVDTHPVQTVWDSAGKRVMAVVPTVVKHQSHQIGIIVRQTAA